MRTYRALSIVQAVSRHLEKYELFLGGNPEFSQVVVKTGPTHMGAFRVDWTPGSPTGQLRFLSPTLAVQAVLQNPSLHGKRFAPRNIPDLDIPSDQPVSVVLTLDTPLGTQAFRINFSIKEEIGISFSLVRSTT